MAAGALMDEWISGKLSEPPPVYKLTVFPGRRDTEDLKKNKRDTDSFLCTGPECTIRFLVMAFSRAVPNVRIAARSADSKTQIFVFVEKSLYPSSLYSKRRGL